MPKAVADAAINAEMPSAAAVMCTMMPAATPAQAIAPPFRPICVERANDQRGVGSGRDVQQPAGEDEQQEVVVPNKLALRRIDQANLARSCGAAKSSCGPTGTMPAGFTCRWL